MKHVNVNNRPLVFPDGDYSIYWVRDVGYEISTLVHKSEKISLCIAGKEVLFSEYSQGVFMKEPDSILIYNGFELVGTVKKLNAEEFVYGGFMPYFPL